MTDSLLPDHLAVTADGVRAELAAAGAPLHDGEPLRTVRPGFVCIDVPGPTPSRRRARCDQLQRVLDRNEEAGFNARVFDVWPTLGWRHPFRARLVVREIDPEGLAILGWLHERATQRRDTDGQDHRGDDSPGPT